MISMIAISKIEFSCWKCMKWIMTHTICIVHMDILFHKLYCAFLWNLAQKVYDESWKVNLILILSSPVHSLNYLKVKCWNQVRLCNTAQTILILCPYYKSVGSSLQHRRLTWPYLVQSATLVLSHKKSMSDIHTGMCNCKLSSFTWNNYLFYSLIDILSQNNSGIWSVKWNFSGQKHWNYSDFKWQNKGKIVVWALNAARYLNRNCTQ